MADANQEAQELARALAQLNQEMMANGRVSKETQDAYTDALVKSKTGIQSVTKAAEAGADALGKITGATLGYINAMADGKQGAAASNEALGGMAEAAKAAGVMLSAMIPGGPAIKLLIAGITALIGATVEVTKKANEMADSLNKGYRGLAKSGAVASEGMEGLRQGSRKLGLSIQELDGYVNLVNDSSKDLASFAGSAFEGRRQFEDMGKAMMPFQQSLMNAGMSQMEITEGAMGYLRLQARLGQAQGKTQDQLAEGARKYLLEQDALTKITGQSRKEMEDQRARALQQQQFAAKVRELQLQGREAEAEQLMQLNSIYAKFGPKTQAAFQASVTGNLANADALGANIQSQGEMMRTAQMVASGQMKAVEAAQATGQAMGKFTDTVGVGLAQVNAFNGTMGDFAEGQQARIITEGDLVANLKKAQAEQEKQGATGKKATDAMTQQYTEMIQAQQQATLAAQEEIAKLIPTALKVNTELAEVTGGLIGAFIKLKEVVMDIVDMFSFGTSRKNAAAQQRNVEEQKKKGTVSDTLTTTQGMDFGQLSGANGGIFRGPESGYPVLMHGDEAIIPMDKITGAQKTGGIDQLFKGMEGTGAASLGASKDMQVFYDGIADAAQRTSKFSTLSADHSEKYSDTFKEYVDTLIASNRETLKDTQQIASITDRDLKLTDIYSKSFDRYTRLRMQIIELETPLLDEALQQLQGINPTPSVGAPGTATLTPGGIPAAPGMGGGRGLIPPALSPAVGAPPGGVASARDLTGMGLKLKQGDVHAEGSAVSPKLLSMAQQIQSSLPDFAYFSGFNDKFHQEKSPSSQHTKGLAADFVLSQPPTPERGQEIVSMLKGLGASTVIDEYNQPSSKATAGHIHVQVPEFEYGGIAVGPDSGYPARLHGTEAILPMNNGAGNFVKLWEDMSAGIAAMNNKMDEMVRTARNSVDVQTKILKANY